MKNTGQSLMKYLGYLALSAVFILSFAYPSPSTQVGDKPTEGRSFTAVSAGFEDNLVYLPIPPDLTREGVVRAGESVRNRLHGLILDELVKRRSADRESKFLDRIVILTDHDGRPILPDADAEKSSRLSPDLSKMAVTIGNELSFTFVSSTYPWTADEIASLTSALGDLYPTAKAVYGNPVFNITVNIRKDPTISYAGLYYPSLNEIVMNDATSFDVLCHEMIHAFRDDYVLGLSSYEEGMTRAAEIEVFDRLANYTHSWDEAHSYTYDVYYEGLNNPVIGAKNGNLFAGYIPVLLRYQLAGYAWGKILLESPNFLIDFNRALYPAIASDPETQYNESKLVGIAGAVQFSVEGAPFLTWYGLQYVFNTNPPTGYFLYQRINQYTIDHFYRDLYGTETIQANVVIDWAVYDNQDVLLSRGSDLTGVNGFIFFYPTVPPGYSGRLKMVASAASPAGTVGDTSFRPWGNEAGVFGVVVGFDLGTVTITPLDDLKKAVTVPLVNGGFSAPKLASVRGRFTAQFTDGTGQGRMRQFNKDASDYFVLIATDSTGTSDLSVTMNDSPDPVKRGETLTYTITVINNGPDAAENVVVTDVLPSGVTDVSATASQGFCSGSNTVSCSLETINNNSSSTVTIVVKNKTRGMKSNTASVTSSTADPNMANNNAAVITTVQ